jgi:hypothetical protein
MDVGQLFNCMLWECNEHKHVFVVSINVGFIIGTRYEIFTFGSGIDQLQSTAPIILVTEASMHQLVLSFNALYNPHFGVFNYHYLFKDEC